MSSAMDPVELLSDVEAETRPDCASGIRKTTSTGSYLADLAVELIVRLTNNKGQPKNEFARRLISQPSNGGPGLADCRDSFASWSNAPPSSDVRARVLKQFSELHRAALDYLSGTSGSYAFGRQIQ